MQLAVGDPASAGGLD